jgi:putative membrane-bound dehydrogenase-like protein
MLQSASRTANLRTFLKAESDLKTGRRNSAAQSDWLRAALCLAALCTNLSAGPLVAPTEPLTPQEQIAKFHLPPGFEIQLVASEPDIQKPMNLNFDSRGRLWVSHSIEYPFPADGSAPPRDAVTILDGIGPDGKATRISKFADQLNIPIGVLPLNDGTEAIVWSIPHLWKMRDTDGDGTADQREVLFGPYDYVDTHGNQNSLKLGLDGWVYACHGFRNDSKIRRKGEGPVVLELQSGNTYRFRPDGSEIEHFGWGQVNPFGSCFDQYGNFFTADCHSKPVSLVLRGGYIESFGKPHDGPGFTPAITGDDHGSTGIAGVVFYDAPQFPAEYRHNLFVGNVVTNRVHRDVLQWRGSSPWIAKPEDFVVCDDWWFHPVDLQLGPDGALYIADFYNCIIGHYEVDLKHPRRDRHRGRVWRVVWKGIDQTKNSPASAPNLAGMPTPQLFDRLNDSDLVVRTLATNELTTRRDFVPELQKQLQRGARSPSEGVHLTWASLRGGELTSSEFLKSIWGDGSVRANWLRAIAELPDWKKPLADEVRRLLGDEDPQVRRIAAEALGRHPEPANIALLAGLWSATPPEDALLIHAVKIALRNQLRTDQGVAGLAELKLPASDLAHVAEIALAVPNEAAAWFTFDYVRHHDVAGDMLSQCLSHVARHVGAGRLNEVADFVQTRYREDLARQLPLFQAIYAGLLQKGTGLQRDSTLGNWGAALAAAVLNPDSQLISAWSVHPVAAEDAGRTFQNPWGVRNRNCADGRNDVLFFDSLVHGESLTGILRSRPLTIPETFSFWICGHNGFPGTNPEPVNQVRLKLLTDGEVIASQFPPRNDTAQKVTWDLRKWSGKTGVLELVDADAGPSYAWLGVSRFDPPVVAQPSPDFTSGDYQVTLALKLVEQLKLKMHLPRILALLSDRNAGLSVRSAAVQAVMPVDAETGAAALQKLVADPAEPAGLRSQAGQALSAVNSPAARTALTSAFAGAPGSLEQTLALALAATPEGLDALLEVMSQGKASARLLQDPAVIGRLKPRLTPERSARIAELTASLPPADQRIRELIVQRQAKYPGSGAVAEKGAALFKTHCAACHKIGDVGQKVGPQLDGIGQRGIERLLEDILDPNRNIDGAFRATAIATKAGIVITGLKLRDEGQVTVIVDSQGKEQRIAAADIEESQVSPLSPMPSNFADTIPEPDFQQLLAFLLSQKQVGAPAGAGK